MMVAAGRLIECAEELPMRGKAVDERFDVLTASSSLTFFAASSSQSAYGKTTELGGYVNAAWNADGSLAREPAPQMHVEFKVESLRTGNDLQDREMWKLIDSKRFPKVAGDLTDFSPSAARGRYNANGQITLAGLSRRYTGEFHLEREGDDLRLEGDLNVDVRDFGLKPLKLLVLSVAPLVRVRLRLVAERA